MDQVVVADSPIIPAGADPANPVLYPKELKKYSKKVMGTAWEDGAAGQKTLSVYLDDGKSGTARPVLIQFCAHSQFGLDFFKKKRSSGYSEEDDEEEPKKKSKGKGKETKTKKKPRQQPALITFDYNKSPHVQILDEALNKITENLMSIHLPTLKQLVAPGNEDKVTCKARSAARASSGRVRKGLRTSCYPGGCEFRTASGENVSFNTFLKSYRGDYRAIAEFGGITASYKDEVLSYGPVLYIKKLAIDEKVQRPTLEWREEEKEESIDLTKKEEEEGTAQQTKKRKIEKNE